MRRVPIIPTPLPKVKYDGEKGNRNSKPNVDVDISKAEDSVYQTGDKSDSPTEKWADVGSDAVDLLGAIAQFFGGGELYKNTVKQIAKYNGTLPDHEFQSLISRMVNEAIAKGSVAANKLTSMLSKLDSVTGLSPTIKQYLGRTKAELQARLNDVNNKNSMLNAAAQLAGTQANTASDVYNTAGDYATGRVQSKQQAAYETASKAQDLAKAIEQDVQ